VNVNLWPDSEPDEVTQTDSGAMLQMSFSVAMIERSEWRIVPFEERTENKSEAARGRKAEKDVRQPRV